MQSIPIYTYLYALRSIGLDVQTLQSLLLYQLKKFYHGKENNKNKLLLAVYEKA